MHFHVRKLCQDRFAAASAPPGVELLTYPIRGGLRIGGLVAATSFALVGCWPAASQPPSVLLIVIDTLRADRLGAYGHEAATSPHLDRFANEAVVFDDAVSPAPFTMPAVAALMTGLYPDRAGVINHSRKDRLATPSPTLAEIARRAGYRTAAVVSNPWLRPEMLFDRGFERYVTKGDAPGSFGAAEVTDRAIEIVESLDRAALMWVHYIDAHMPYRPPRRLAESFGVPSATTVVIDDYRAAAAPERQRIYFAAPYSAHEIEQTRRLYDASIRLVDENISRLLAAVDERLGRDDTIVVVAADHGESLGDHGLHFAHDFTVYQELVHVPLMIRAPGVDARRVRRPVSLVDVLPTLCALTALSCPLGLDGRPLPLDADATDERAVFAANAPYRARYHESPFSFVRGAAGRSTMIRLGTMKLIRVPRPEGPAWELYDLEADPRELRDAYRPAAHAPLAQRLERWIAEMESARSSGGIRRAPGLLDDDTERELRSLGYLD